MPRTGPRRPPVTIRLSAAGRDRIDELAAGQDTNRSEMIRRMLAYAITHMPEGWKP